MGSCFCKLATLFLFASSLFAMEIGNPSLPTFTPCSLVRNGPSSWGVRLGYIGDYVYSQHFKDEFEFATSTLNRTRVRLHTNAGTVTFNFKDRLDLYGILGASKIQIDEEIIAKSEFAWGVGTKFAIYTGKHFRIGADLKYFESDQRPIFFICEHLPYNIINNFHLKYWEMQGALGMTYRTHYFAPYIHATYLFAKISPQPVVALVRLPSDNDIADVISKSVISQHRWGMALGLTLIDQKKATLSVEWRAFNQNSVDVSGELRF